MAPRRVLVGSGASVAEQVCAEMVGNVFRVVVAEGDAVERGATLLLLESMKMEIPVVAEAAGTVDAVRVREGDVVQEGDVLVVIDPEGRP